MPRQARRPKLALSSASVIFNDTHQPATISKEQSNLHSYDPTSEMSANADRRYVHNEPDNFGSSSTVSSSRTLRKRKRPTEPHHDSITAVSSAVSRERAGQRRRKPGKLDHQGHSFRQRREVGAGTEQQNEHLKVEQSLKLVSGTPPASASTTKKVKKEPVDAMLARPSRERARCPKTTQDRCSRAMSQRMFMIERVPCHLEPTQIDQFKVLGSTGNVYTVTVGPHPDCDCPDCSKGNVPCKHIIFVFLKVLKVPQDSNVWYQKGLTPAEVQWVFQNAPSAPCGSVTVNATFRNAYLQATGGKPLEDADRVGASLGSGSKRKSAIGEDCPVCYEEMTQQDDEKGRLVYDESMTGCGRPLHTQCFKMWSLSAGSSTNGVTCVWCRSPWIDESQGSRKGKKKASGREYSSLGYLNMASAAGISRQRDVSTYHYGQRYLAED